MVRAKSRPQSALPLRSQRNFAMRKETTVFCCFLIDERCNGIILIVFTFNENLFVSYCTCIIVVSINKTNFLRRAVVYERFTNSRRSYALRNGCVWNCPCAPVNCIIHGTSRNSRFSEECAQFSRSARKGPRKQSRTGKEPLFRCLCGFNGESNNALLLKAPRCQRYDTFEFRDRSSTLTTRPCRRRRLLGTERSERVRTSRE